MANIAGAGGGGFWAKAPPPAQPQAKPKPTATRGGRGPTYGVQGQVVGPNPVTNFVGEVAHNLSGDLQHPMRLVDPALGMIGASRKSIRYAVQHPKAQVQGNNPYAPAQTTTVDGKKIKMSIGMVPWGPGGEIGSGLGEAGAALKVPRTAEQAAAHIGEVTAKAAAEGHGAHIGGWGNPPIVEKGVATEATGRELGRQVRESLLRAPAIRKVQTAGYSEERTLRVRAATEAGRKAGGGTAGHIAAKRHLADALPKEFFGDLQHLTSDNLDYLTRVVDKAPLQLYEKTHVVDSIKNAVDNAVVPTAGDQALIERVFGRVAGQATEGKKLSGFWDKFVSATNIPRALRSSGDISAGFRQGLTVLVTHPKVWARQWVKSVKSFGSEDFYQAQQAAIHADPLYPLMAKYKVPFTEIGGSVPNTEEAFIGAQAAERIPLGIGNIVRRSDRAFTGFQNGTRAELFKMLVEKAALTGEDLSKDHLGESIAKIVGTFTGRGVTPKILEKHLTTLNAAMFSPRLMFSRLNLLSPKYYHDLDPFARREAMAAARNLVASIGTVMFVAKALGAQVEFDPRSSNFAKIKVGNTRIDIAGGYSQYVRFIAQEMTREAISSSGHKSHIGWGKTDTSDLANLTRLGRSKAAPIPAFAWDELSGKDFVGRPVKQGHELWSNAPFVAQDTYDAYQQKEPAPGIFAAAFLSAIGLGVQSYKDKQPKGSGSSGNWFGGGSSGGSTDNWYGGGGSGGSSGFWGK